MDGARSGTSRKLCAGSLAPLNMGLLLRRLIWDFGTRVVSSCSATAKKLFAGYGVQQNRIFLRQNSFSAPCMRPDLHLPEIRWRPAGGIARPLRLAMPRPRPILGSSTSGETASRKIWLRRPDGTSVQPNRATAAAAPILPVSMPMELGAKQTTNQLTSGR